MSIRSLIEINHDYTGRLDDEFTEALRCYLTSGDVARWRDHLGAYGVRVVAQRHHSADYHIPSETDGFPAPKPQRDGGAR